ncbi:MAG: hypothetical protein WKF37_01115 [Bryobacteraceae bacterium]
MGYRKDEIKGGYHFSVLLEGDSNTGHEFSNEKRKGVIGPLLSPQERYAIIEYL